ncbi:MAG: universal stress protein [Deltaproteobacteria bacterium]|jgi:nucleotide-binding universal stress UspA family protein
MFRHILVPLDGSNLAESVLPAADYLGRVLKAKITLIHIVEQDASPSVHGERHLTNVEEAEPYLAEVARRAFSSDVSVEFHVHTAPTSDVARGIVEHQHELTPDLIVMCTHGRSGVRDLLFGRIAQQVVGSGRTPVLLMRPEGVAKERPFFCRTLLAPTDGTPKHEAGLNVAFALARAIRSRLHLLSAVRTLGTLAGRHATTGRFMPGTTQAVLELAQSELEAYLQRQVSRFQAQGVSVSAEVRRGDPAAVIAATAAACEADIIVLATHGKAGLEAFWAHSVAAGVLAKTRRPLLLVPVKKGERRQDDELIQTSTGR